MKDFLETKNALEKAEIDFFVLTNNDQTADIYVRVGSGVIFIEFAGENLELSKIVRYDEGSVYTEQNFINRVLYGDSIACAHNIGAKTPSAANELVGVLS